MANTKILFSPRGIKFILEALDLKTDKQGFVVKKDGSFVFDPDGLKFKPKQIIGIVGKEFITKPLQLLNTKIK